jgi:hypothetical protein
MLQIIRAEFEYRKAVFICTFVLIFALFLTIAFMGFGGVYALTTSTMIAYWVLLAVVGSGSDRERHDRLYVLLPIPLRQISIGRLLFWMIVQFGWFALWLLMYFLQHFGQDSWTIWSLLSMNALVFIVICPFFIYHDLGFWSRKGYRLIFWGALLLILGAIAVGVLFTDLEYELTFGPGVRKSPWNAAVLMMLGAALTVMSHSVFLKRRSYVA